MDPAEAEGRKAALDSIRAMGGSLTRKRLMESMRPPEQPKPEGQEPEPDLAAKLAAIRGNQEG